MLLNFNTKFTGLQKDFESISKELLEVDCRNTKQHEEFYASKYDTTISMTRLIALFEGMTKTQEVMANKIDRILDKQERQA